jgi:hypothetical protein
MATFTIKQAIRTPRRLDGSIDEETQNKMKSLLIEWANGVNSGETEWDRDLEVRGKIVNPDNPVFSIEYDGSMVRVLAEWVFIPQ